MDKEKVKTKSFEVVPVDNINNDLELVNQHAVKTLTTDEVYLVKGFLNAFLGNRNWLFFRQIKIQRF